MVHTFAAIDVGSFELTMKIFEYGGRKPMKEIDCIVTGLSLGADTYATGKISQEKVDELCRVLQHFASVMRSYKVESYKAYGTSAIRETVNSDILLDLIETRTGIRIDTLSNSLTTKLSPVREIFSTTRFREVQPYLILAEEAYRSLFSTKIPL